MKHHLYKDCSYHDHGRTIQPLRGLSFFYREIFKHLQT